MTLLGSGSDHCPSRHDITEDRRPNTIHKTPTNVVLFECLTCGVEKKNRLVVKLWKDKGGEITYIDFILRTMYAYKRDRGNIV